MKALGELPSHCAVFPHSQAPHLAPHLPSIPFKTRLNLFFLVEQVVRQMGYRPTLYAHSEDFKDRLDFCVYLHILWTSPLTADSIAPNRPSLLISRPPKPRQLEEPAGQPAGMASMPEDTGSNTRSRSSGKRAEEATDARDISLIFGRSTTTEDNVSIALRLHGQGKLPMNHAEEELVVSGEMYRILQYQAEQDVLRTQRDQRRGERQRVKAASRSYSAAQG